MPSLQDALINAKLATESQILKETPKIKQEEKKSQPKQHPKLQNSNFEKFESLWDNEKSRPFAIHLLHSFLPFPDNSEIWDWKEKPQWKNGKKCCICQLETLCKQDLFEKFDDLGKMSFDSLIKKAKDPTFNSSEFMKQEKQKLFGDRIMGITSDRTSCIMCAECYHNFAEWVPTKMLMSNEFQKVCTFVRRSAMAKAEMSNPIDI